MNRAEQVVEDTRQISDFAYYGDLPLGETWGFTISTHRDANVLERSNWEVISEDMLKRFPQSVETVSCSHWAVGWVEHLAVRMLTTRGKTTKAGEAILEWREALADYPVASDSHYSQMEYDEALENLEWRCSPDNPPDDWKEKLFGELHDRNIYYEEDYFQATDAQLNEVMTDLGWMEEV